MGVHKAQLGLGKLLIAKRGRFTEGVNALRRAKLAGIREAAELLEQLLLAGAPVRQSMNDQQKKDTKALLATAGAFALAVVAGLAALIAPLSPVILFR
jgi:hypothetical protein